MSKQDKGKIEDLLASIKDDQPGSWPGGLRRIGVGDADPLDANTAGTTIPAQADTRMARALDAAVQAAENRRPGRSGISRLIRFPKTPVLFAAASVLLVLGPLAFIFFRSETKLRLLGRIGNVSINGGSTSSGPADGTRMEIKGRGILYLGLGSKLRMRITGPALVEYREGDDLFELFVRTGRLDVHSRGAKIPGFRVTTTRSRIKPLGTMFSLDVNPRGEIIRLLEGRLNISDKRNDNARILNRGRKLEVDSRGRRAASSLSTPDLRELGRIRDALGQDEKISAQAPDKKSAAQAVRSLEDIRSLYGFVSEYELSDGRRPRGYLLEKDGRTYIHTIKGLIAVRQSDIQSINLIE